MQYDLKTMTTGELIQNATRLVEVQRRQAHRGEADMVEELTKRLQAQGPHPEPVRGDPLGLRKKLDEGAKVPLLEAKIKELEQANEELTRRASPAGGPDPSYAHLKEAAGGVVKAIEDTWGKTGKEAREKIDAAGVELKGALALLPDTAAAPQQGA
jgi:hypothetical protein